MLHRTLLAPHIITLSKANLFSCCWCYCLKPKRDKNAVIRLHSVLSSQAIMVKTEREKGGEHYKCSSTRVAQQVSLPSASVIDRPSALNNLKASAGIFCKHKASAYHRWNRKASMWYSKYLSFAFRQEIMRLWEMWKMLLPTSFAQRKVLHYPCTN